MSKTFVAVKLPSTILLTDAIKLLTNKDGKRTLVRGDANASFLVEVDGKPVRLYMNGYEPSKDAIIEDTTGTPVQKTTTPPTKTAHARANAVKPTPKAPEATPAAPAAPVSNTMEALLTRLVDGQAAMAKRLDDAGI